jgi:pyruvate formate lyase activating enzyme
MEKALTGNTFNIQRFSTEDGPGIRTTVFMKGCPLRCKWCHNPEGIAPHPQLLWYDVRCIGARDCLDACPNAALALSPGGMRIDRDACQACGDCADACPAGALELIGKSWTVDALVQEAARDTIFYEESGGGVTVSGGEPLMQAEFTIQFLAACQALGLHTALDTSAFAPRDKLEKALAHANMALVDMKNMDPAAHKDFTGVPLEPILDNLKLIGQWGRPVWIRTPIIPGHTDSPDNIASIAAFISEHLPNCERYDLLAFSNLCISKYQRLGMEFTFEQTPLLDPERFANLRETAIANGVKNVITSGMTARKDQDA